jgi:hypothetical protein
VQIAGDVLYGWTMSGESVLYRSSDEFSKTALLALFQFFVKSWSKHVKQFIIARDERATLVTRAKNDGVLCGASGDRTSKVSFEQAQVSPGLRKLKAQRSHWGSGSMATYWK